MEGFHKITDARTPTFFPDVALVSLDVATMATLRTVALEHGVAARACLHGSPEDPMHVMVIVHVRGHYWRPMKHVTKSKVFHVIEGAMAVVRFNTDGAVAGHTTLSAAERPLMFLPPDVMHTNIALSSTVTFLEVMEGPFQPDESDRVVAPFAPSQDQQEAGAAFASGILTACGVDAAGVFD